jgi:hypothetical protein
VSAGTRFFVLCPDCRLGEVHDDLGAARRLARGHRHAGAAVVGVSAIAAGDRGAGARNYGLILTLHGARDAAQAPAPTSSGRPAAAAARAGAA